MLNSIFLAMPTIIGALLVLLLLWLIIAKMLKDKKQGKSTCGSCSGCPSAGACHRSSPPRK